MESVEELIELVRQNDDIANHADDCTLEMVEMAEDQLGLKFPPSYRRIVLEFGTFDIAGEEFLGVYRTLPMGEQLLGSVSETIDAREQWGLPESLLVFMYDGMGGLLVLDTAVRDSEGESPVLAWESPFLVIEKLGNNFGSYALEVCQHAVRQWRQLA